MTNELTSQVLSELSATQQQLAEAQQRIGVLSSLLLQQLGRAPQAVQEPRTCVERVMAYYQAHGDRSVANVELREALPDVNPDTLGGIVHRLKKRGFIASTGWGAYRLASAPVASGPAPA